MHFTYQIHEEGDENSRTLQQGDVLAKTDGIKRILREIHPHYLNDDYTHFLVLTQSCDLVIRQKACSARYITLAAVRPLEVAFRREIERFQSPLAHDAEVCKLSARESLKNYLKSLLNNNNKDLFYLHEEPAADFTQNACAFLRLSVAIRAYQHYQACLSARILSLSPVFQAKLGWLTGDIYSRVGTEDWTPQNCSTSEFNNLVESILDQYVRFVEDRKIEKADKADRSSLEMDADRDKIRNCIDDMEIQTKKTQVIDRVIELLSDHAEIDRRRVFNLLNHDPSISVLLKSK